MSYEVIGCWDEQVFGRFDGYPEAHRYITDTLTGRAVPKKAKNLLSEPMTVIDTERPRMPYLGMDKRLKEINERHKWEAAHRVREVLG
ncbi:hypothetical protein [Schleiferilactobacillus harbinensis]|uniref:Uncharacterized protein n=1 Tax=Schleiferilactobacillus harbinensis TaxID=304207 RepID=A0A5P8M4E4_9LACO|nr:hypothetical protein [Schleiferilactobacillus harbinensis]QEU46191.1 hypothetical protein FMM01_02015 [Schleiferilactobacillus harbinensis]QFR22991.1 hypothetical protein D1010_05785 [Schleiferilactobacillus harbinensis]